VSIEQTEVVDAISVDPETGEVVLTIADHLDWQDVAGHVYLLQEKVNAYLAFIESGEIGEAYPQGDGRRPRIDVVAKTEVIPDAKPVLAEIETALRAAGIGFRAAVLRAN
jgi:hypothetical protein